MVEALDPEQAEARREHLTTVANAVRGAFSPAAPINHRDLFAGRLSQLSGVLDAVQERGRHVVIYGERGVGKTSLASVLAAMAEAGHIVARVNCQTNDTFAKILERLLSRIKLDRETLAPGFRGAKTRNTVTAAQSFLGGNSAVDADDIRDALDALSTFAPVLLVIDEFDRLESRQVHHEIADLLKALSDDSVPVTIMIVGVADDVNELINEHLSVERNLKQVLMPRMSHEELLDVLQRGCAKAGIEMEVDARHRIASLSQGLPHYTHLLAQIAGVKAVYRNREVVTLRDVEDAIAGALTNVQESVTKAYHRATFSAQANLYKQVLLACACAQGDDRGFFTAAAVRGPLTAIMGKPYHIPAFAGHLNALSDDKRGRVLKKEGDKKRFGYRFTNPLLQPYVLMRGLNEGMLTQQQIWLLKSATDSSS